MGTRQSHNVPAAATAPAAWGIQVLWHMTDHSPLVQFVSRLTFPSMRFATLEQHPLHRGIESVVEAVLLCLWQDCLGFAYDGAALPAVGRNITARCESSEVATPSGCRDSGESAGDRRIQSPQLCIILGLLGISVFLWAGLPYIMMA